MPDGGQLHHTVSGDLNAVLGELVQRLGLWERMAAEESASGMSVSAWEFSRASADMDAYTGIRAMLRSAGAKLRIRYDSALRKAVLSAVRAAATTLRRPGRRARGLHPAPDAPREPPPLPRDGARGLSASWHLYADRAGNVTADASPAWPCARRCLSRPAPRPPNSRRTAPSA
ncbi:MAG: hypothetical protein ACLTDR_11780 [Adlercreutzia equolifaciens]